MNAETPEPNRQPNPPDRPDQRRRRRLYWRLFGLLILAAVSLPVWRAFNTRATPVNPGLPPPAAQSVAAAKVTREDLYNEITIPAEFRPYLKVELHAKVSGYVEQINVDIGDQVKAGQLLAKLEVPELRDELARAKAVEQRAEADYRDAHLVYTRLQAVDHAHPDLVAQQDLDAAQARDATTEAAIASAQAEVQREQTLLAYTRITAPFDGVITHRYADPGSLIQAGTASDTQSMPLVCLSDNYLLRLDFPVSVAYVKDIRIGEPVEVRVESLNGKSFTGTISRSAQKVDEQTRTMITEIEVPNPSLELVPGMYCTAALKVEKRPQVLTVPIEAVPPGHTTSVYVINDRNEIEDRPVTLGLDTPTKYEVKAGLKEGELVLVGSRAQVHVNQKVVATLVGPPGPQ